MAFADQIADDLSVFLGDFGRLRSIDGAAAVLCVLEDEERLPSPAEGVYLSRSVLHVRLTSLPARPVIEQRITIDGRPATVIQVAEAEGLLSIGLEWKES